MRKQSGTPQNNSLSRDLFQGFLIFILIVSILFIAFGIIGAVLGQEMEPQAQGMWEVENVKASSQLCRYHYGFL